MIVFSQANYDAFVGTWSYQENDTVFKIRLQKGTITNSSETYDAVFGGYSLSVRGILKEHYIQAMPMSWNYKTPAYTMQYIYKSIQCKCRLFRLYFL